MTNRYLQWKPADETEMEERCRGLYSGVKIVRGGREWVAKIRIGPAEDEASKPQTITLSSPTGVLGDNESSVFKILGFQDGS